MNEAEKAYQYFVIAVPENEEQAKAYFWARKALRITLTPPNEWVSVEDELPARDGVYLVFTTRGSVTTAHFYAEKTFSDGHRKSANWQGNRNVTHWMPLPAPPGKDNNVLAKTPNEPLMLEHLRASPHGKIKDSTLRSICNRANEIACRPPEGEENA